MDPRFREHCPVKVRGRDAHVLYRARLEAEREQYMELDVPDICHKRSFYYDVVEGKPFNFTPESSVTMIQIKFLLAFLNSGGQPWTLEE